MKNFNKNNIFSLRIAIFFVCSFFFYAIILQNSGISYSYAIENKQAGEQQNNPQQGFTLVNQDTQSLNEASLNNDIIEENEHEIMREDSSLYDDFARIVTRRTHYITMFQNHLKEHVLPHLITYAPNPKYHIYAGEGSHITLVSKITADSRLGSILNEWVFHGNTIKIVEQAKNIYDLGTKLRLNNTYYVTIDVNTNELIKFEYEIDSTSKIVVDLSTTLADASQEPLIYKDNIIYEIKLAYVSGEIQANFSNSAIQAGENANFVNNFANIFGSDIDFSREIQKGDRFTALVEKRYRDGNFMSYGDIIAAQFVNNGHIYNAYYFYESPLDDEDNTATHSNTTGNKNETSNVSQSIEGAHGTAPEHADKMSIEDAIESIISEEETPSKDKETVTIITSIERPACAYFDEKGQARQKAFLRAPVHFTRVSSVYTMSRRHPILGVTRPHQGIDYAAPTGTPVYTVGDGTVTFVGWSGGYGRLIKVRHSGGLESQYAHLSRYASGLKVGAKVSQGETIGYVGSSGLSTGPHLDFRIKKNGEFVNPDSIIIPSKAPVTPNRLEAYLNYVDILNAYLSGEKPLTDYNPSAWLSSPAPPE